ncbi:MAG: TetR/AcrR family transcriptional regulator [Candidatus Parcubacteria bacterium]|uniref:TetR/AcrR family transcriptional regulator n=1 Tax=Phormidesmis priestleyi TaxID=268141 RepID=UPI00083B5007|nr:TetR/AcrR family transcriptional regulator [Phormidesmis priestleyi]MBC7823066.1 TetR/AcrR family transcriptional regulator [Leptolyngbyaceae cyanobacterium LF-bin-113]
MKKSLKPLQLRYDVVGRLSALLDAGETLLCEGYDKAQPQLIANTAGISVGLFYRHFKNKQELLTAVMVRRLNELHTQIAQALQPILPPTEALHTLLLLTLKYFHLHQGLIKLFFMQIGYGDSNATEHLKQSRQTYRDLLSTILEQGMNQGVFLPPPLLNVQVAINSIIGTINWSLYDLLVVQNQTLEPEAFAEKLFVHLLRSLTR